MPAPRLVTRIAQRQTVRAGLALAVVSGVWMVLLPMASIDKQAVALLLMLLPPAFVWWDVRVRQA